MSLKIRLKQIIHLIILSVIVTVVLSPPIYANQLNFSVEVAYPDNQVKGVNYLDLRMKPKQKQEIELTVRNPTDKDRVIDIEANQAVTNDSGYVEYNQKNKGNKQKAPYDFEKMVDIPDKVSVKAGESEKITLKLLMPKKSFDGIALGGLYFKESEKTADQVTEGAIKNTFSYTLAIQLRETDTKVEPSLKVTEVSANQVNYKNLISARIINDQGVLINPLTVEGLVKKKGSQNILYSLKREQLNMAPFSQFDFSIPIEGQLEPGKYVFTGYAQTTDEKWEFEEIFLIKKSDADTLNKQSMESETNAISITTWIIGTVILTGITVAIIYIYKHTKERQR